MTDAQAIELIQHPSFVENARDDARAWVRAASPILASYGHYWRLLAKRETEEGDIPAIDRHYMHKFEEYLPSANSTKEIIMQ